MGQEVDAHLGSDTAAAVPAGGGLRVVVHAQRRRQAVVRGDFVGGNQLTRRQKSTDEILEELLDNPESDRPLRGHEIARILFLGRIEPGEYRYEIDKVGDTGDSVEIETFKVDEDGNVKDLKTWRERPDGSTAESATRKGKGRRSKKRPARPGPGRNDR